MTIDETVLRIKAWWKSATIWLGGLVIAIANLGDALPAIGVHMDPWIYQILGTLVGLAIIYTRLFGTNQAVTIKAAMKPVTTDQLVSRQ